MKHHCHCGFKKHREHLGVKRVGLGGAILMVLHLLYHVAECLILPAVFTAFSQAVNGQSADNINSAESSAVAELEPLSESSSPWHLGCFDNSKIGCNYDFASSCPDISAEDGHLILSPLALTCQRLNLSSAQK